MNDQELANKHRESFENFISKHKLKLLPWSKKAGVSEATIRNYLKGRNQSLTLVTLTKLANAIGFSPWELIDEEVISDRALAELDQNAIYLNKDLFIESAINMEKFLYQAEINLDIATKVNAMIAWYELAQILEKDAQVNKASSLQELIYDLLIKKIS